MNRVAALGSSDRDLLRIVACGSVDDGKSTLIGRLLAETGSVPADVLEALGPISRRYGTVGKELDFSLLLDGLEAEREQGITIDVAYRCFATKRRSFVVADAPGHEQYTRNMVVGASNADLAILLVNAHVGATIQTIRHSRIVSLLGIGHVALVVNKMDLVGYSESKFAAIREEFASFARGLGFAWVAIPGCARDGDNVVRHSARMPWYDGPTILQYLESIERQSAASSPLRFLVQSVTRTEDFRGYAGLIASGSIRSGERIALARSGQVTDVASIVTFDGDLEEAEAGQAVTLVLASQIDVGRGDILTHPEAPPEMSDQFAADLVWLDEQPLLPGRSYLIRTGMQAATAAVTALKHKVDIESGAKAPARSLAVNEIGFCNIAAVTSVAFDPYTDNRATGAFILIDRDSAATVGAGMIRFPLRRAKNIVRQKYSVDKSVRALMKAQRPCIVWFTGLPASGKSTIANLVDRKLISRHVHTYVLDGDNLRRGLNRDLGFTDGDRVENIRRAGEVARLMVDAGLVVLCAFVSPFRSERQSVRELVGQDEFIEVFVDTPLEVCMNRDPKGLYKKAREGTVFNVTGLDSRYEPPRRPDITLATTDATAEALADTVIAELIRREIVLQRELPVRTDELD
jgi:bifunctional enzyme CysN/CysC